MLGWRKRRRGGGWLQGRESTPGLTKNRCRVHSMTTTHITRLLVILLVVFLYLERFHTSARVAEAEAGEGGSDGGGGGEGGAGGGLL